MAIKVNEENMVLGGVALAIATLCGVGAYQRATETPEERKARLKAEAQRAEARRVAALERAAKEEAARKEQRERAERHLNDPFLGFVYALSGETGEASRATDSIIAQKSDSCKNALYKAYTSDGIKFTEVQKYQMKQSFEYPWICNF